MPDPRPHNRPGLLRVQRTVRVIGGTITRLTPKTRGSRRKVPLTAETTALLARLPRRAPARRQPCRAPGDAARHAPTDRLRATDSDGKPANKDRRTAAQRQADTLARLTVVEAQARLVLDWSEPLRHATFYKAVYRPAVLRAMRQTPRAGLSAALKFHSLRHTYASLCASTDIATVKPV